MRTSQIPNVRHGYLATSVGAAVGALIASFIAPRLPLTIVNCDSPCLAPIFLHTWPLLVVGGSVAGAHAALSLRGHECAGRTATLLAVALPLAVIGVLQVVVGIDMWLGHDLEFVLTPLAVVGYALAARRLAVVVTRADRR